MLGRVRSTLSSVIPDHSSSGYGSNSYSDYGDVYNPTSSYACKYNCGIIIHTHVIFSCSVSYLNRHRLVIVTAL